MKKSAVLSIAAFYLLLTTGMFVCIVHCAGEYFFQPKMVMHNDREAHGDDKHKQCDDKGCGCCDKHDNYVVKENILPAPDFQAPQIAVLNQHHFFLSPLKHYPKVTHLARHESHAPPNLSGKSIVIKFRSILI
ncbi:ABC-type nickel/cobalt efflux system permease component RcnA [Pedobacter sp. UYP24]